ncbi:hypothetical protein FOZ63_001160 [Perkinsus olseni]|uniref:Uncharacterized protein n=1 Tax=Perkinsus olseni TaxID=32597 RepID=A0A7J6PPD0_PEROL|nr:hypothetical protein FOZ63_001160 [Perkinsus olseni]
MLRFLLLLQSTAFLVLSGVVYPQGFFERLHNPLASYSVREECVSDDLAICLSAHEDTTAELSFGFTGTHGFFETRTLKVALAEPDGDGVMTAVVQPESPHQIEDLREVTSMPTLREIGVRYPVSEDPRLVDIIFRRGARTRRGRSECSVRLVRESTKPLHGREAGLSVKGASLTAKERLESVVGPFDEDVVDSGASDDPAVIWKGRTGKGRLSVEDVMAWLDETEEEGKSSRKGDEGESVGMDGGVAEKKGKDGIADDKHHRSPSRRRSSKRARTNGRGHDAAWAVMTPSGGVRVIEEKGGSTRGRRKVSKVDPGIQS